MFAVLLGLLVGLFAGLIPGLHVNVIALAVLSLSLDPWTAAVFIVTVAVARSVCDAVPTVFLGASDDVLGVLPGQRLLREGRGLDGVKWSVVGAVLGLCASVILIPALLWLVPLLFSIVRPYVFWLLVAIIIFLVAREDCWWWALLVFLISGILGMVVLDSVREPLFPLLSGLFGASGLVLSLAKKVELPVQRSASSRLKVSRLCSVVGSALLAGVLVLLFPGLGPSQGAALAQVKRLRPFSYLVLTGALGTVDVVLSLIVFFVLDRARNGAVVAVQQLVGALSTSALLYLIGACLFAGGFAAVFAIFISGVFARFVTFISYQWISAAVLCSLVLMAFFLSGTRGVFVLFIASLLGLVAPAAGVSRSHAMGCLLLPTLAMLW
ncbi:tripartite tricarboxylate transporter permease [Candidatus Woesearchaeota archaeon]|nr:tripartite tricarboxylate transporter permease [Candidatus Woesearchaeota archaeon]